MTPRLDDRPDGSGRRRRTPVLVALGVLLAVGVWIGRRPAGRDEAPPEEERSLPLDRMLRYPVPVGQDAARVMAVLDVAGYEATLDEGGTAHEVVVRASDRGRLDRERVRALIADAGLDMAGRGSVGSPVRFSDEEQWA
jgi:hypothetical protein